MVSDTGFGFQRLTDLTLPQKTYRIYQLRIPDNESRALFYSIGFIIKNSSGKGWLAYKNNSQLIGRYETRLAACKALGKLYLSASVPAVDLG